MYVQIPNESNYKMYMWSGLQLVSHNGYIWLHIHTLYLKGFNWLSVTHLTNDWMDQISSGICDTVKTANDDSHLFLRRLFAPTAFCFPLLLKYAYQIMEHTAFVPVSNQN